MQPLSLEGHTEKPDRQQTTPRFHTKEPLRCSPRVRPPHRETAAPPLRELMSQVVVGAGPAFSVHSGWSASRSSLNASLRHRHRRGLII